MVSYTSSEPSGENVTYDAGSAKYPKRLKSLKLNACIPA
jgi:hypothetical protein